MWGAVVLWVVSCLSGGVCSPGMNSGVMCMEVLKGMYYTDFLGCFVQYVFFFILSFDIFLNVRIFFIMEEKSEEVKAGGPN